MQSLFDYTNLARETGVSMEQLAELERLVRQDYGSDEMMIEPRLLRTFQAIRDGVCTTAEALADLADQSRRLRGTGYRARPLMPAERIPNAMTPLATRPRLRSCARARWRTKTSCRP